MTGRVAALAVLAMLAAPSAARGQGVAISGYGVFGDMRLAAAQTFDAVSGTSHTRVLGGGIHVANLWNFVFADLAISSTTIDGERVSIDENGTVHPLGIRLEVAMRYVDVGAGWRKILGRVSPYVGGGFSRVRYRETSELAQPGEDVSERATGPLFLSGIDITVFRRVRIGAEFRYRWIGGVLGSGGASAKFGEDSAGGLSTAVRVSIGFIPPE